MPDILHFDWSNIGQIAIEAPALYFLVVLCIRVIGNRSTSSMNSFDWIITVAVGGIFASTVILERIHLLEGGIAIVIMLGIQYCVTFAVRSWSWAQNLMKSTPQLLVYDGEFLDDNMRSERIVRAEIYSAIREKGYKSLSQIYAVVLETDSRLSVISKDNDERLGFSLADVEGLPEGLREDLEKRGEHDDTEPEPETVEYR